MVETMNKRIKSIGHKPTTPKMKSKKEKGSAKGGSSNKGKQTTRSPSPPPSTKATPWFLEEHYEVSYKYNYVKEFIKPMFLNLEWLKTQWLIFPKLLEYHGLNKLVEMKGTFYLELVRVFYTTTHIDGETRYLYAKVKGKTIVTTPKVWEDIVGWSLEGMLVNDKGL